METRGNIRMSLNTDFTFFKSVHSILRPANVWITAKARPETLPLMKFLARLCCSKQVEILQCTLCTNLYLDKLNNMTSDCSHYKIHATRTDYYAKLKTFFSDSLCEFILCSTSAKRVMYFLSYVDAALECNIQTCKYSDFLSVTAKYLRRIYSCYNDCL